MPVTITGEKMEKQASVFQDGEALGKAAALTLAHTYAPMRYQVMGGKAFRKYIGEVLRPLEHLLGSAPELRIRREAGAYDAQAVAEWLDFDNDRLGLAAAVQGMVQANAVEELGEAVRDAYSAYRGVCLQKGRQHDYGEFFKQLQTQMEQHGYTVDVQVRVH